MSLILCPQASGKTFAFKNNPSTCVDLEQVFSFNASTLKCSTATVTSEFDLTHYWMRYVLVGVLACVSTSKTALVNLVSSQNAPLVSLVVRGLKHRCTVQVVLPDEETVEERLGQRRNGAPACCRFKRGDLVHVASIRCILAGIAQLEDIPIVREIVIEKREERPIVQRVFIFDSAKAKHR